MATNEKSETRTGLAPGTVIAGAGVDKKPATAPISSSALVQPHGQTGMVRFKLDGPVKTVNTPVTGAQLHRMAGAIDGYPVKLKAGGSEVPDNDEPFEIKQDQELSTTK